MKIRKLLEVVFPTSKYCGAYENPNAGTVFKYTEITGLYVCGPFTNMGELQFGRG